MTMHSDVATVPGWYGKLPSLGDFASRRLESDFIEPWDLWLGDCMQAQRDAAGDEWLQAYRQSPPWRFVLSPGALPGAARGAVFAGVLLASVDRVGRHFPLTIAASLPRAPRLGAEVDALLTWLHRLEDTALDAVQGQWSIDELEQALAGLAPPTDVTAAAAEDRLAGVRRAVSSALSAGGGFVEIGAVGSRAEFAAGVASAFGAASVDAVSRSSAPDSHRMTVWIAEPTGQPSLLVSDGLPGHDDFARMFSGGGAAASMHVASSLVAPLPAVTAAAVRALIPDDADLLAMFDATVPASEGLSSPSAAASPPSPSDDIFALLDAGASAVRAAESPSAGDVASDDILALFDAPSGTPAAHPAPAAGEGHARGRAPAGEPDLLDLFADMPATPAPDKTD
jgi:type VI secretion system protein ImpM